MRGNGAAALGSGRRWRELLKVVGLVIMTPAGQDAALNVLNADRLAARPSHLQLCPVRPPRSPTTSTRLFILLPPIAYLDNLVIVVDSY